MKPPCKKPCHCFCLLTLAFPGLFTGILFSVQIFTGLIFVGVAYPRKLVPNENFCVYGMYVYATTQIFANFTHRWRLKRQTNGNANTVIGHKPTLDNNGWIEVILRSPVLVVRSPVLEVRSPVLVVRSPVLVVRSPVPVLRFPVLVIRSPPHFVTKHCFPFLVAGSKLHTVFLQSYKWQWISLSQAK